ncbi:MAG: hypothetical protein OXI87_22470 [Albidovulum sp.]|nr:hypothetical protein [Albidovulum sp.]MDE0533081.1 hypothetical protein [Albidovulum sp.]
MPLVFVTRADAEIWLNMSNWKSFVVILAIAVAASMSPANAQEKVRSVAVEKDWSVFENDEQCWVFSAPTSSENTRGGRPADVRRGEIGLFVGVQKGASQNATVSFSGGYPFRKDSVRVSLGSSSFTFLTGEKGLAVEWAWPLPIDEEKVIDGLKRGNRAIVTGVSQRGTNTKDTFSLLGFTAALEQAVSRCK